MAQHAVGNAIAGVGFIAWDLGILAANLNAVAARGFHADDIVDSDSLVDGLKRVKTIGPRRANRKAEIDLGK
jgi:hypothetical protein